MLYHATLLHTLYYFLTNETLVLSAKLADGSLTRNSNFWCSMPFWEFPKWLSLPTQESRVQSLGREDALEKEMATHSSILAWENSWTEEPGGLQSTGSQDTTKSLRHDLVTKTNAPLQTSEIWKLFTGRSFWARHPLGAVSTCTDKRLPSQSFHSGHGIASPEHSEIYSKYNLTEFWNWNSLTKDELIVYLDREVKTTVSENTVPQLYHGRLRQSYRTPALARRFLWASGPVSAPWGQGRLAFRALSQAPLRRAPHRAPAR